MWGYNITNKKVKKLKLIFRNFITYKLLNSLFLGLSVGSIFTIYTPIKDPSIYSIGGIFLAVGMLAVAQLYQKILTIEWFYRISLFVELVMLAAILWFLKFPYTYQTALLVYSGYQLTFIFGSYLMRAETLIVEDDERLRLLDSAKQIGYLVGMAGSYVFYKILGYYGTTENQSKVYDMHWLLLGAEILIIILIIISFKRR